MHKSPFSVSKILNERENLNDAQTMGSSYEITFYQNIALSKFSI